MALKPPPISEVIQQVNELVGASGIREEVDKSARALAQSALGRLDMVSRDEFDAQAEILKKMQTRVRQLETQLEDLGVQLKAIEDQA
jgi:BMFP domain-containing protein YqiC